MAQKSSTCQGNRSLEGKSLSRAANNHAQHEDSRTWDERSQQKKAINLPQNIQICCARGPLDLDWFNGRTYVNWGTQKEKLGLRNKFHGNLKQFWF